MTKRKSPGSRVKDWGNDGSKIMPLHLSLAEDATS